MISSIRAKAAVTFLTALLTSQIGVGIISPASAQPPYAYTDSDLVARLPAPILDDHPEWLQVYWKAWQIARDHIYKGTAANGFVPYWMDECFTTNIFQWDSFFMMMFGRYGFNYWPSIVTLENFYRKQEATGYICREITESDGSDFVYQGIENTINPPIYAWAEWEHYLFTGDKARFTKVVKSDRDQSQKTIIQRIIAYHNWVDANRKRTATGLYWNTGLGSGMDNTARVGQDWIDMSAQVAMNALYISRIATEINDPATAQTFKAKFDSVRTLINQKMWDPVDRFYYDIQDNGAISRHKTIASAWPLLAEVADSNRAAGVVALLTNPNHFWRYCPFPTLGASEPEYVSAGGYWLGSVWSPTNYMAIRGLMTYGYDSIADSVGEKFVKQIYDVYKQNGSIWENYSADQVSAGDQSRRDFVGWGGIGPIAIMFENIIGITVNAPKNTINWRIHRLARHGISKLQFGSNQITITAAARTGASQMPVITVDALQQFTLNVSVAGKTASHVFPAGNSTWTVDPVSIKSQVIGRQNHPGGMRAIATELMNRHIESRAVTYTVQGKRVQPKSVAGLPPGIVVSPAAR